MTSRNSTRRALDFTQARFQEDNATDKGKQKAVEPGEGATEDFSDDGIHLMDGADGGEEPTFGEAHGDDHEAADVVGDRDLQEDGDEAEQEEDDPPEELSPSVIANASRQGRKRKNISPDVESGETRTATSSQSKSLGDHTASKRSGRNPKKKIQRDEGDETQDPRPTKKARGRSKAQESNLQLSDEQQRRLDEVVDNYTKTNGPLGKNRSLVILRRETPSDSTVKHTRSGRVSVKPLAYWRNEKIVYGSSDFEIGQRFPMSTITEIIRTEQVDTGTTKKSKRSSKKKQKPKKDRDELSDDETAEHAEPWETEGGGVFYGPVKVWDPELQAGTQNEEMMGMYHLFTLFRALVLANKFQTSRMRLLRFKRTK